MRNRRHLAVLLGLLICGIGALFFPRSQPTLVVHGKPVSEWALALAGPAPTEAAKEVIKSFGPEAVPGLIQMLRTKDSLLSRPISALSGRLSSRLEAKLDRLFRISESPKRRYVAALALGLIGTNAIPAIPPLIDALRDRSGNVRMTAAVDLARLGSSGLPGLIAALDDRNVEVREAAMTGLSHMGFEAEAAVPKLVALLEQPTDRMQARAALQAIGKRSVAALIKLLDHPSEEMRIEAIGILGNIGSPARAAIPSLTKLAKDPSQTVRSSTMNSLGLICRSCDPVISVLQNGLDDESRQVRRMAADQLSVEPRLAEQTVGVLLRKVEQGSPAERQRALSNLGLMGRAASSAVPSLRLIAESGDGQERVLAREALRQIEAGKSMR